MQVKNNVLWDLYKLRLDPLCTSAPCEDSTGKVFVTKLMIHLWRHRRIALAKQASVVQKDLEDGQTDENKVQSSIVREDSDSQVYHEAVETKDNSGRSSWLKSEGSLEDEAYYDSVEEHSSSSANEETPKHVEKICDAKFVEEIIWFFIILSIKT